MWLVPQNPDLVRSSHKINGYTTYGISADISSVYISINSAAKVIRPLLVSTKYFVTRWMSDIL